MKPAQQHLIFEIVLCPLQVAHPFLVFDPFARLLKAAVVQAKAAAAERVKPRAQLEEELAKAAPHLALRRALLAPLLGLALPHQ